jgi:hypothetical protein
MYMCACVRVCVCACISILTLIRQDATAAARASEASTQGTDDQLRQEQAGMLKALRAAEDARDKALADVSRMNGYQVSG